MVNGMTVSMQLAWLIQRERLEAAAEHRRMFPQGEPSLGGRLRSLFGQQA